VRTGKVMSMVVFEFDTLTLAITYTNIRAAEMNIAKDVKKKIHKKKKF
jgi:hypothetical protein